MQIKTIIVPARVMLRSSVGDEEDEGTAQEEEQFRFTGEASVYGQPALIGSRKYGFVEWIAPGAARNNLEDDVRFLVNHDSSTAMGLPLARTASGTMKLSESKKALIADADLAPVTLTRDLKVLIDRGDVNQMSFAFVPGLQTYGTVDLFDPKRAGHYGIDMPDEFDGMPFVRVDSFERLYDVSAVTYPAYEGTTATMNNARRHGATNNDEIDYVIAQTRATIDPDTQAAYRAAKLKFQMNKLQGGK